jgi:hypothetical protein
MGGATFVIWRCGAVDGCHRSKILLGPSNQRIVGWSSVGSSLVAACTSDLGQLLIGFSAAFAGGCVQKDSRLIAASLNAVAPGIQLG